MKLFKLGKHSIQFKIWSSMLLTIAILMVFFTVLNFTLLSDIQDDIFLDQLENASHAFLLENDYTKAPNEASLTEDVSPVLVTHMGIHFKNDEKVVRVDRFTSTIYDKSELSAIIPAISGQITSDTPDKFMDHVKINQTLFYYYVVWVDDNDSLVFFLPRENKGIPDLVRFGLLFLALIIISFFTSSFIAKKLARPIKELESFANEIAHRHWSVSLPKTDPDEIGRLAESLESMRDSLKIAEERDRQFLQSSSHDLKTPVMVIKGYAQAMMDGVAIGSTDSAAMVIKNEAEKLERRILQLLRLNTLGHSLEYTNERDYVRIDRIINSLVKRCGVINPSIHWDISLEELEIIGDSEALVIAFENLFENQLRYAQSVISIRMDAHQQTVVIENDGPSFTVSDPMVLFDSYKKDEEGKFGLGLAIVWQVMKAHESSITAENTSHGVSFTLVFK